MCYRTLGPWRRLKRVPEKGLIMADPRIPQDMVEYMQGANWGEHHDQWHYEQRYDFWHYRADHGDAGAAEVVAYGDAKGWGKGQYQEGAPGNGLHFLAMHRAMFQLLAEGFPQHSQYLRGWHSPPQDPSDPNDPVAGDAPFPADKARGVLAVETDQAAFATEDEFGLFIETNIRPTPDDPTVRTQDGRTGLHNFLHNRWTDDESPVNLGDPRVNIFNARFWRLHGWIERLWTEYRAAKGLSDQDPAYVTLIRDYRHMMSHGGHKLMVGKEIPPRPKRLQHLFAEDE